MRKLFENLLMLSPQNTSNLVLWIAGLIWILMWWIAVVDVWQHPSRGGVWKFLWMGVLSIPVFGLLLYSIRELISSNTFRTLSLKMQGRHDRRGNKGGVGLS